MTIGLHDAYMLNIEATINFVYLPTGICTPLTISPLVDVACAGVLEAILKTAMRPLEGRPCVKLNSVVRRRTP